MWYVLESNPLASYADPLWARDAFHPRVGSKNCLTSLKKANQEAKFQAPVVQIVDSAIHRIYHYPVDSVVCFVRLVHWIAIYPVDSIIHPLNHWAQVHVDYSSVSMCLDT